MADLKMKALGLDSLFQGASIGLLIIFLAVVALILIRSRDLKSGLRRGIGATLGFAFFYYMVFVYRTPAEREQIEREKKLQQELSAKFQAAKPIFERLCAEQTQPIINRRIEDVEGILLLKVRPSTRSNYSALIRDQWWPSAAFDHERTEDSGYAEYFLLDRRWTLGEKNQAPGMRPTIGKSEAHGFKYVDVLSDEGRKRTRITAQEDPLYQELPTPGVRFHRRETNEPAPRYAVTYEDNLDPELRKHWIAGTTIKVLDMKSGEVIGQRSYWKWDAGFGVSLDGRSPWGTARSCPSGLPGSVKTHEFVDQVLLAKQRR